MKATTSMKSLFSKALRGKNRSAFVWKKFLCVFFFENVSSFAKVFLNSFELWIPRESHFYREERLFSLFCTKTNKIDTELHEI